MFAKTKMMQVCLLQTVTRQKCHFPAAGVFSPEKSSCVDIQIYLNSVDIQNLDVSSHQIIGRHIAGLGCWAGGRGGSTGPVLVCWVRLLQLQLQPVQRLRRLSSVTRDTFHPASTQPPHSVQPPRPDPCMCKLSSHSCAPPPPHCTAQHCIPRKQDHITLIKNNIFTIIIYFTPRIMLDTSSIHQSNCQKRSEI